MRALRARMGSTSKRRKPSRVSEVQKSLLGQTKKRLPRKKEIKNAMKTTHGLICPFLTDDPVFAYGVEFGMLYVRMRDDADNVIDDYFCRENQDQILLLAS